MTQGDYSGYKLVPRAYDLGRWQHRLFVEIRKAPLYKASIDEVRAAWEADGRPGQPSGSYTDQAFWLQEPLSRDSRYFLALESACSRLGLNREQAPVEWAIDYLHDDVLGHFLPNRPPLIPDSIRKRTIEIRVSAHTLTVTTYRGDAATIEEVRSESSFPQRPMIVGEPEWEELTRAGVNAVVLAVDDLKASYAERGRLPVSRIKGKNEEDRELQIQRLALRLTGRSGTRNSAKVDRDWCRRLGINTPANR